jgi:hypothetical protein
MASLLFQLLYYLLMPVPIINTFLLLKRVTGRLFCKVSKPSCLASFYIQAFWMFRLLTKACWLTGEILPSSHWKEFAKVLLNSTQACYLIFSVPAAKHWDSAVDPVVFLLKTLQHYLL